MNEKADRGTPASWIMVTHDGLRIHSSYLLPLEDIARLRAIVERERSRPARDLPPGPEVCVCCGAPAQAIYEQTYYCLEHMETIAPPSPQANYCSDRPELPTSSYKTSE